MKDIIKITGQGRRVDVKRVHWKNGRIYVGVYFNNETEAARVWQPATDADAWDLTQRLRNKYAQELAPATITARHETAALVSREIKEGLRFLAARENSKII